MLQTGIVLDTRYQDHNPGPGHPERAERIGTLLSRFASYERDGLKRFEPRRATHEEIALVHDTSLIGQVAASAGLEAAAFDADTRCVRAVVRDGPPRHRWAVDHSGRSHGARSGQRLRLGATARTSRRAQPGHGLLSVQQRCCWGAISAGTLWAEPDSGDGLGPAPWQRLPAQFLR